MRLDIPIIVEQLPVENKQSVKSAHEQIIDCFYQSILENHPQSIHIDDKIHRFNSDQSGHKKNGWYCFKYVGDVVVGAFGCWKRDYTETFKEYTEKKVTAQERERIDREYKEIIKRRELERKKIQEAKTQSAIAIWESCIEAESHEYLERKKINAHGCRVTNGDNRLVVPMIGEGGHIEGLQFIDKSGEKRFQGSFKGKYFVVGSPKKGSVAYIAEGFATAASIFQATNRACFVAFNSSALFDVANRFKDDFKLVNVADNDEAGRAAIDALNSIGVRSVLVPMSGMDANDFANYGGDLVSLLEPMKEINAIKLGNFNELKKTMKPINWLVKNWLQKNALIMVHGPSGAGKSYAVLDWCMRIATPGFEDWAGNKVKNGTVVYLAGEGNQGLIIRACAWEQKHKHTNVDTDLWISGKGCSLNKAHGYKDVVESIDCLEVEPDLIVVDTLHRFLDGDENSAQDAGGMIKNCDALKERYGCSVILVHHTGASSDAQNRARGSTAWRGALDGEISLKGKDGRIELTQCKNKELGKPVEGVVMEFESVDIPGLYDEDNEQVSSSILVTTDEKPSKDKPKDNKKLSEYKSTLIDMCADLLKGNQDGDYTLPNAAIQNWLVDNGYSATINSARNMTVKRGAKMFAALSAAGLVASKKPKSWTVIDDELITRISLII